MGEPTEIGPQRLDKPVPIHMTISATYQPYAECATEGCPWETGASASARILAKSHAKDYGHRVRIIVESISVWGPK